MRKVSSEFGVVLDNVPLMNLRNEFLDHYALMRRDDFRQVFSGPYHRNIETPYLTWHGYSDAGLTVLILRALIGIEALVSLAVYFRLGHAGRLNNTSLDALREPFSLGGRGTADTYYNRLPCLVSESLMLKSCDETLWRRTQSLYKEVRNPIFHGYEVKTESSDAALSLWEHVAKLHEWVDSWFDIDTLLPRTGSPS